MFGMPNEVFNGMWWEVTDEGLFWMNEYLCKVDYVEMMRLLVYKICDSQEKYMKWDEDCLHIKANQNLNERCTQIVFYTSKMCNVKMYWEITWEVRIISMREGVHK